MYAVTEQRGSDLREMSELESRIEELQLALDLESTKTQGEKYFYYCLDDFTGQMHD